MTPISVKRLPVSQHARNKTTPEVITYRHSPKWPPGLTRGMPGPGELNLPGALLPKPALFERGRLC
jgi:hypothetical protein